MRGKMLALKYSGAQHREYFKMIDLLRLRWKHIFNEKPQYSTTIFRSFILDMWKVDRVTLSSACNLIADMQSINTQREYIYRLCDDRIIESDVYVGSDKNKRELEDRFGRGRSSPLIWLSHEARAKVDLFLDNAIDEIARTYNAISNT
jgi:hypothetical protein